MTPLPLEPLSPEALDRVHAQAMRLLAQAAWLALIGCSLGVLVGAVPGAAASWSVMHSPGDTIGPTVGLPVPWPTLLGALVAIPMLAGLCGMLLVRRDPVLTRRAT